MVSNVFCIYYLLQVHDFKKFQPLRQKLIDNVDKMLAEEVSRLMSMVPTEESEMPAPSVQGGAFEGMKENPFNLGANEGRWADRWFHSPHFFGFVLCSTVRNFGIYCRTT